MKTHRFATCLLVLGALLVGRAAFAVVYDIDEANRGATGALDQANVGANATDGSNNYCAPTATMNSFIYLQNAYPNVYGNKLYVAGTNNSGFDADAALLAGPNYMNTTPNGGTSYSNLISGKVNYINTYAPGTTYFEGFGIYNAFNPPGTNWIQGGQPTAMNLVTLLQQGQDVEIWVTPAGGGIAHVMTLNSIDWDTTQTSLVLDGIDPTGGVFFDYNVNISGGALVFGAGTADNLDPNSFAGYTLNVALAESPIPEPATLSLALLGGAAIVGRIRRKAA